MASSLLDLRSLQVLAAVCEKGSMTVAAQRLGVTQSAISQHIRQLENQLGAAVLDRSSRPVRPTRAGVVLWERARRIIADVEAASAAARLSDAGRLPELRLGINHSLSGDFLHRLVLALATPNGLPFLNASTGCDLAHGKAVVDGTLDVAIIADPLADAADLERHELLVEPFILVTPIAVGRVQSRADVADLAGKLPFIRYSANSATGQQIERHLRRLRIDAPRRIGLDSQSAVFEMVAQGLGWSILPPLALLHAEADLRRVQALPFPAPEPRRALWLIARKDILGEMPEQLANLARDIFSRHYEIRFRGMRGWIAERVEIVRQSPIGVAALAGVGSAKGADGVHGLGRPPPRVDGASLHFLRRVAGGIT